MSSWAVVDAHALIWFLQDDARLGPAAAEVLSDPAAHLICPGIALAEACLAIEKGRTSIPSVEKLLADVRGDARVSVISINKTDVMAAIRLSQFDDLHDRLIVAVTLRYAKTHADA